MPRDINGVYTLPAPMPVQPRTIPVTNVFNTVLSDVKDALNNIPGGALADNSVTNAKTDLTNLRIRGTAGGTYGSSWVGFYNEDLSSRWGYVGKGSPGTQDVYLEANVGRIRLNPSAADPVVTLTSGQLQFPATQNPSTDPNTLDDYEEGTWTPTLTCATPGDLVVAYSATNRTGQYQKVGNTVHFQFRFDTTTFTHTTAAGTTFVTGLPFTPKDLGYPGAASGWVCSAIINGLRHSTLSFSPFLAIQSGVANFFLGVLTGQPGTASVNVTNITDIHTSGVNVIIMGGGSYQV